MLHGCLMVEAEGKVSVLALDTVEGALLTCSYFDPHFVEGVHNPLQTLAADGDAEGLLATLLLRERCNEPVKSGCSLHPDHLPRGVSADFLSSHRD